MSVKFGLSFTFTNPEEWRRPWHEHYESLIQYIIHAEELGFEHIWVSEHHLDPDGYTPSPISIITAIAARTKRIKVSTNILILPFYNALRLAEDLATIDILSNGRVMLGIGMGYRDEEFVAYGQERKRRVSRTSEGIQVMRGAWAEGPFSFTGSHYQLDNVDIHPKPIQAGGPPLFLATASEAASRRAARMGLNILPQGDRKAAYDPWLDELASLGRRPEEFRIALGKSCFVTTSQNDPLWDQVAMHARYAAGKYADWNPNYENSGKFTDQPELIPPQWAVGSPEVVIQKLEKIREMVPATDIIMQGCPPGMDPDRMRPRLEMFAREVMPHFA